MRRISNNCLGIDHGESVLFSDFEHNGDMWTGNGPRLNRSYVEFSEEFRTAPHVTVALTMWDISNSSNSRADIQAENVTNVGFDIVFRTWSDTQVARVRVSWTAFGAVAHDDGWDLY